MNEDLLSGLPTGGLDLFVPDPALDSLYKQLVATARQFGWPVPAREDFERQYKAEVAGKVQR